MLFLALILTSIIAGIASFVLGGVSGQTVIPEMNAETVGHFFEDYFTAILLGFITIVLLADYAAIAAIFTRSIVGGTVGGMGIMVFELFLFPILNLLATIFNMPDIVHLYRLTPTYNLENAGYWIRTGAPSNTQFFINLAEPDSLLFSLVMLTIGGVGALLLTAFVFNRRDITT